MNQAELRGNSAAYKFQISEIRLDAHTSGGRELHAQNPFGKERCRTAAPAVTQTVTQSLIAVIAIIAMDIFGAGSTLMDLRLRNSISWL